MSLKLPENIGDRVTGFVSDYFSPYCKPKTGDYLVYNPYTDKLVIMSKLDIPEYIVRATEYKMVLKRNSTVTIEKVR